MLDIVAFFGGGVSYEHLKDMPLTEVIVIHEEAIRIRSARQKAADEARRRRG